MYLYFCICMSATVTVEVQGEGFLQPFENNYKDKVVCRLAFRFPIEPTHHSSRTTTRLKATIWLCGGQVKLWREILIKEHFGDKNFPQFHPLLVFSLPQEPVIKYSPVLQLSSYSSSAGGPARRRSWAFWFLHFCRWETNIFFVNGRQISNSLHMFEKNRLCFHQVSFSICQTHFSINHGQECAVDEVLPRRQLRIIR